MEILIMRHGEAVGAAPGLGDAGRFLTEKGRRVTRRVARWLAKKSKRRPVAIWTSPLVRAVQTAEIVAEIVGLDGEVVACAELSPGRDPGDLLSLLSARSPRGPIALIGHEPSLSVLASSLLNDPELVGDASHRHAPWPGLKKSAVLALSWEGSGPAKFRFVLDPKSMEARGTSELEPPDEA
jgi:phosphohistidine phosphatase